MAGRDERAGVLAGATRTWRRLHLEQRLAGVAAVLIAVSTLGPFSFVEAAEILVAVAVLALLRQRAERRRFHLPFGDGIAIAAAGAWCAVLIATRMFDRPPGQTALALVCAGLLLLAGLRERSRRPPDDLPDAPVEGASPTAPGHGNPGGPGGASPAGHGNTGGPGGASPPTPSDV